MPSPILTHRIYMPKDKPCKCDDCPLFAYLPEHMIKPKSKYVRMCLITNEYLSNRAGHLKVGAYCPMRPMSKKLTERALKYADETITQLIKYKKGLMLEFPKPYCEYFGLIHEATQEELTFD